MKNGQPTINDVARLSGVSKKTVSRVINRSALLNQDTRERVEAVISEFGYVPNPQARALALRRNFLIGLLHDNSNAQMVLNVQEGILEGVKGSEFELVIWPPLTTVRWPIVSMARAAALKLIAGEGEVADEPSIFLSTLVRRAINISADFSSIAPVQQVVDEALGQLGRIDILVNNAGIIRRQGSVDFTEADWDADVDTNLKFVFFLSQAVGMVMIAQGAGKIINIALMLSFQGGVRVLSYTASKSGLAGLTKLLANEWAVKGVNVNAIAPGYIATNSTAALQADAARNTAILDRIPAGRWSAADDLGGAAVFLASSAANYIHGHILAVDGGWLAR